MTITTLLCGYPCGKEFSDIVPRSTIKDSANGSIHNNAGLAVIGESVWPGWVEIMPLINNIGPHPLVN